MPPTRKRWRVEALSPHSEHREKLEDAIAACRVRAKADPAARNELIDLLREAGRLQEAEKECRSLITLQPDHVGVRIALGGLLIDLQQPVAAEAELSEALTYTSPAAAKAAIYTLLGLAQRRQRRDAEALQNYDLAYDFNPGQPELEMHRGEALQNLKRYEDATAAYRRALDREPRNPGIHRCYNDLLYRLGGMDDYLKSYDRVPRTADLLLGKGHFLNYERRFAEAYEAFLEALMREPGHAGAVLGAVESLRGLERYDDAAAALDALIQQRGGGEPQLLSRAAEVALLRRQPDKAAMLCEQGLRIAPYDQSCLVGLSLAWRIMGDERDEALSRYDRYIRAFDLKAPDGFSSMADFNAELSSYLDRLHPGTREYPNQSLRGGTQTPDHIFDAGHDLIDRLERRISEAVQDYIAGLEGDATHPFVSRRSRAFQYRGSWSSRLGAEGFHVNHIHPQGWISSCYYVSVPNVTKDTRHRQGWIKFGEPGLDVDLANPIRLVIQPVPGRLVLFPSFMWHGTVPVKDEGIRTTVAFDVVPKSEGWG